MSDPVASPIERLVVFTTETLHHAYFVRELAADWPIWRVVLETRRIKRSFETAHPFEARRDEFERRVWFDGAPAAVADLAETLVVETINEPRIVSTLVGWRPVVIVVFGTGKLSPSVIDICPLGIVNLHGGDPETHRGLDSHLWAIHEGDVQGLQATLHRVSPGLDEGEIIDRRPIPLAPGMRLHELRRRNTEICLAMVDDALEHFRRTGAFRSRPQRRQGRYLSAMPAALKEECVRRFERHTGAST